MYLKDYIIAYTRKKCYIYLTLKEVDTLRNTVVFTSIKYSFLIQPSDCLFLQNEINASVVLCTTRRTRKIYILYIYI